MKIARRRAGRYCHKRSDYIIFGCAALSCCLTYSLIRAFTALTADACMIGEAPQTHGSMLLFESAKGYVMLGIVSFVFAVTLTLICIRRRSRHGPSNGIHRT